MAVQLFPEQVKAVEDADRLYSLGHKNVMIVLPTGVGKTLIKAWYAKRDFDAGRVTVILAHRDVLLGQISDACCMLGLSHSFICSDKTRGMITNANQAKYGDNFHNQYSRAVIISVDTFLARLKKGEIPDDFLKSVYRWSIDETHHLTKESKWGQCVEAMTNALGLGVTATPIRGDRKGLGIHADGYYNAMSVTTTMFDVIKSGRLTPYKILAPSKVDVTGVKKDKDGDYNKAQLYIKTKEADITGDAVQHYLKHLAGQPVITFCINIQHSIEVAKQFNAAGVPSVAVSSKSLDSERIKAVADLRAGRLLNLVNCDLFGEGFDAPAVMGVIMLRRTESYSLFKQQFGRMLRTSQGKVFGWLLDHVGNTRYFMEKFGLAAPHDDPVWTLDRADTRKKQESLEENELVETMVCGDCGCLGIVKPEGYIRGPEDIGQIFINGKCPECGHEETEGEHEQRVRELKIAKGDLEPLEFDVITQIIDQRNKAMMPVADFRKTVSNTTFSDAAVHQFANKQHALSILMHWIQAWCTEQWKLTGQSVALVQLDFELVFKVNILKAQVMSGPQMNELAARIQHEFYKMRKAG